MVYTPHQHYPGDQINKNKMGGACSVYGGQVYIGIWWGNLSERDQLLDLGVDGRIILKLTFKKWDSGHRLD
jgi:hypothetical protein